MSNTKHGKGIAACPFVNHHVGSGLSRWLGGKEPICQCRRHRRRGCDPWVGKTPWRRKRQPTPVFSPGESHEQRSLAGYSPWGRKGLALTECEHTRACEIRWICRRAQCHWPLPACSPCGSDEARASARMCPTSRDLKMAALGDLAPVPKPLAASSSAGCVGTSLCHSDSLLLNDCVCK